MTRQARAFTRPAHAPSGLPHATRRRHDWWCARSATPQHVGDTPAPSRRRPPPVRPRVGAPSCAPAPLSPTPCVARTQHEGSTTGPRVTLLRALRPDVGGWVTLSPRYWTGVPSDTDGGRAPYSAVLDEDLSWSSKLAYCLSQQCKRICAKAETCQRRVT